MPGGSGLLVGVLEAGLGLDSTEFRKALAAARSRGERESRKMERSFRRVGRRFQTVGAQIRDLTGPLLLFGGVAARQAIRFESSFAGVRKTVNATEQEFAQLRQQLRDLAAGDNAIPIDVNELNQIAETAGQLGVEVPNLIRFTETVAKLRATTNLAGEEGAQALARFQTVTRGSQRDIDRLGSTIVELGNNAATNESEILDFGLRIAGAGEKVGLTQAQILGLSATLAEVGLRAEAGGTAISRVLIDMAQAVENGGKSLDTFAQTAGESTESFRQRFREDAAGALESFIRGLAEVERSGGNVFAVLERLGFAEVRVRDALLRTSTASERLATNIDLASSAWRENTALTEEAAQRFGTAESRLRVGLNRINDDLIEIGANLVPVLEEIVGVAGKLTDVLADAEPETQAMAARVVALAGAGSFAAIGLGSVLDITARLIRPMKRLRGNILELALGMGRASTRAARTSSVLDLLAQGTARSRLGVAGLAAGVGVLSFSLTRLVLEATGVDAVLSRLFERAAKTTKDAQAEARNLGQDIRFLERIARDFAEQGIELKIDDNLDELRRKLEGVIDEDELAARADAIRKRLEETIGGVVPSGDLDRQAARLARQELRAELSQIGPAGQNVRELTDALLKLNAVRKQVDGDVEREFAAIWKQAGEETESSVDRARRAIDLLIERQQQLGKQRADRDAQIKLDELLQTSEIETAIKQLEDELASLGESSEDAIRRRFEGADPAIVDRALELQRMIDIRRDEIDAERGAAAAAEQSAESIEAQLDALRERNLLLAEGEAALTAEQLRAEGASDAQLAEAEALLGLNDQLERRLQLEGEAERLIRETRTAEEERAESLRLINELLAEGLLTQDQYNRAIERTNELFDGIASKGRESLAEFEDLSREFGQAAHRALSDLFFDPTEEGFKRMADRFKATLKRMLADLLASRLINLIAGAFGGAAGGGSVPVGGDGVGPPAPSGSLGFSSALGFGPVAASVPALAGSVAGTGSDFAQKSAAAPVTVNYSPTINAPGADAGAVERIREVLRTEEPRIVRRATIEVANQRLRGGKYGRAFERQV